MTMNMDREDERTADSGPQTGLEILRSLLFLALTLAGLTLTVYVVPVTLRVDIPDFQHSLKKARFFDQPRPSLEAYIASRVKDRVIPVQGEAWVGLYRKLYDVSRGERVAGFNERLSEPALWPNFYFTPDESPVSEIAPRLNHSNSFTYLSLTIDGKTQYLGVTFQCVQDSRRYGPPHIVSPHRRLGLALVTAGFLAYALLPWRRRGAAAAYYRTFNASTLPETMGVVMTAFFYILPVMIVPEIFREYSMSGVLDLSGGFWFALCFWGIGLIFSSMIVIALWYRSWMILIQPLGLKRVTLFSESEMAFDQIAQVHVTAFPPSKWLQRIGWLVSLINWRALGPTLLANRTDYGIEIAGRDGASWRVRLPYMTGSTRLVEALRRAGVNVAPEVVEMLPGEDPLPKRRVVLRAIWVVLVVALGAFFTLWLAPQPKAPILVPPDKQPEPPSVEQILAQDKILRQMNVVTKKMNEVTRRIKEAPNEEQRKAAMREAQQLQAAFDALHQQFEDLSKKKPAAEQEPAAKEAQSPLKAPEGPAAQPAAE